MLGSVTHTVCHDQAPLRVGVVDLNSLPAGIIAQRLYHLPDVSLLPVKRMDIVWAGSIRSNRIFGKAEDLETTISVS